VDGSFGQWCGDHGLSDSVFVEFGSLVGPVCGWDVDVDVGDGDGTGEWDAVSVQGGGDQCAWDWFVFIELCVGDTGDDTWHTDVVGWFCWWWERVADVDGAFEWWFGDHGLSGSVFVEFRFDVVDVCGWDVVVGGCGGDRVDERYLLCVPCRGGDGCRNW
jgi:hypothetical protein